ncbi:protein Pac2p [Trichomonascus vanleenenianus]|uniref:Pac2p n=1 Tax=Trichomonascus vanleenenianus TaxID=2268995 RepID=UPI003ECA4CFC
MTAGVTVGTRLSFNNELCTVRYIGKLPQWGDIIGYGVEWDNPSRGKHSGSLDGIEYFQTKVPGAGSFVKSSKRADGLKTFSEALSEKYVFEAEEIEIRVSKSKTIENVGMSKIHAVQKQLDKLPMVSVSRCCVGIGDQVDLAETETLDIGFNLICDFESVYSICSGLKNLKRLILNGNRFRSINSTLRFAQVTSLSMASTLISPEEVNSLAEMFPAVQFLTIPSNYLDRVDILRWKNVKEVDLSFNELDKIPEGASIETLNLSHNNIEDISEDARLESTVTLNVGYNKIQGWASVFVLSGITPVLSELRINGNEFFDNNEDAFVLTIAILKSISVLNGIGITPQERLDAELYFMSKVAKREFQFDTSSPRWIELCKLHGEPLEYAEDRDNILSRVIAVKLEIGGKNEQLRTLKSATVQKLRALVTRKFLEEGTNPLQLSLFINGEQLNPYRVIGDYDISYPISVSVAP